MTFFVFKYMNLILESVGIYICHMSQFTGIHFSLYTCSPLLEATGL